MQKTVKADQILPFQLTTPQVDTTSFEAEQLAAAIVYTGEGKPKPKKGSTAATFIEEGILHAADFRTCQDGACVSWAKKLKLAKDDAAAQEYCEQKQTGEFIAYRKIDE